MCGEYWVLWVYRGKGGSHNYLERGPFKTFEEAERYIDVMWSKMSKRPKFLGVNIQKRG